LQKLYIYRVRLFAASLLAATAVASQDLNKISKDLKVASGGQFILQADRGSVDVKTDQSDQVQVHVFRKVKRRQQSQRG